MAIRAMTRPMLRADYFLCMPKLTFSFRLLLGLTLLVFGASKLPDMYGFTQTVVSYRVLPLPVAEVYASVLPWAEVVIGLFLILGLGLRFASPAAILVIASFIAGTTGNLHLVGADSSSCGCLRGVNWPLGTSHLVAQGLMLLMAAQIWLHRGELLSLESRLKSRRR